MNKYHLSRRAFINCTVATALSITGCNKSKINKSLQERIMTALKSEFPKKLLSHKFYDSKTIEIYFPDKHDSEHVKKQRERIHSVSNALFIQDIMFSAAGLEGITHGMKSHNNLTKLTKFYEKHKQPLSDEYQENFNLLKKLGRNYVKSGKNSKKIADSLNKISESFLYMLSELTPKRDPNNVEIGSANAPGLKYHDLFLKVFGLEEYETHKRTSNILAYMGAQVTSVLVNKVKNELSRLGNTTDESNQITQNLNSIEKRLLFKLKNTKKEIPINIRKELPKVKLDSIILGSLENQNSYITLGGALGVKVALIERTKYWAGASPKEITGVIAIIGGGLHRNTYIDVAESKKQSYVILPNIT